MLSVVAVFCLVELLDILLAYKMSYIAFRYIALHIFVLLIIFVYSRKLTIVKKDFWKVAFIPIFIFVLEEGLRWGRDGDWWGYRDTYNLIAAGYDVNNEFLFKFFWKILANLGFGYPVAIFFASFLFIFSLFYLLRDSKKTIYLSLPIFVIWLGPLSIQLIRWFMGLSVCFVGLKFLFDKSYRNAYLCLLCSFFIHTFVGVLFTPCFIIYSFLKTELLLPSKVICCSIVLVVFANLSFMENFFSFFSIFADSSRYGGYVDNATEWFATSGSADYHRKSTISYLMVMVPFYIVLYKFKAISNKVPHYYFIYNVFVINILLRSISSGSEIVQRIATIYDFAFLLATTWVLYNRSYFKNKLLLVVLVATFIFKAFVFVKPYKSDLLMMYVWDANKMEDSGKAYLLFNNEK